MELTIRGAPSENCRSCISGTRAAGRTRRMLNLGWQGARPASFFRKINPDKKA